MKTLSLTVLILLTLAQAVLPVLVMVVVGPNHAGDFTWQTQWLISNFSLPALIALVVTLVAAPGLARSVGYPKRRGKIWAVGAFFVLIATALAWAKIRPLHDNILAWNPNWPPADWAVTRDALYTSYAIFAVLLSVACLLFVCGLCAQNTATER